MLGFVLFRQAASYSLRVKVWDPVLLPTLSYALGNKSLDIGTPLALATSLRVLSCCMALTVARALLRALRHPRRLASTFCTPASSNTDLIELPAMTPVPSEAGTMITFGFRVQELGFRS